MCCGIPSMNSAVAKRITSKSPTYERDITSHITPGLLLGAQSEGKHIFTIRGMESQKLISHAKSLIAGSYGNAAHIQVA